MKKEWVGRANLTAYQDSGADAYEQQANARDLAHLRKKAAKLGYTLTATDA